VAEHDAALEEHLAEVAQGEAGRSRHSTTKAMTSEGNCVRFSTPALRSLNCLPQSRQRNLR